MSQARHWLTRVKRFLRAVPSTVITGSIIQYGRLNSRSVDNGPPIVIGAGAEHSQRKVMVRRDPDVAGTVAGMAERSGTALGRCERRRSGVVEHGTEAPPHTTLTGGWVASSMQVAANAIAQYDNLAPEQDWKAA